MVLLEEIYDSHIHSEGRSQKELTEMVKAGIKFANSCAFYPVQPRFAETLIDLFRKLEEFETERGKRVGMKITPALGIHPRCIPQNWKKALDFLEENPPRIFGEVGLEEGGSLEVDVLKSQLSLAKKLDVPCIIHTPRKNKVEMTQKILEILAELSFPENLAVIDHVSMETVSEILKRGYHAGLTVEEGKLSEKDVLDILKKYGAERLMINSDTGFTSLEYLSTSKTVSFLIERDVEREDVIRVACKNAKEFFRVRC
ncbi:MAG: TatD family hydrolase [Archaeoglobus sp.]|nr:TatD family hydrolase [Archaeoglobus sp.]